MTTELEELTRVASELPPEMVRKMIAHAVMLKQWAEKPPLDDIGWTDEDYRETTAAAMRHLDEQEAEAGNGDPA